MYAKNEEVMTSLFVWQQLRCFCIAGEEKISVVLFLFF
jgi:hypothetical protein